MNIKITKTTYEEVMALPTEPHKKPKKPNMFFRTLMKVIAQPGLWGAKFKCTKIGMEELGKKEPCLYLMNHSSFIDFEVVADILYPRPFNIVASTDAFVGKEWLMRQIGCFPTKKFVLDLGLIRDMKYVVKDLKSSVVMFPEAGYSLDGTATVIPDSLGGLVKLLGVPVVMIRTHGAFLRQPVYNNLQKRNVPVSADMKFLLSKEEIDKKSADEINQILQDEFTIDYFRWQQDNNLEIKEPFRADLLNRALYKCPHCLAEGKMLGKGTKLTCTQCGKEYELDTLGRLSATDGDTRFDHIPDWFAWERQCVREEIENGSYCFDAPVHIFMSNDTKHIYDIGKGHLTHTAEGFKLVGNGLEYSQNPQASYSVCADFYWYEIADVVCVGNNKGLFYCVPRIEGDVVAKLRLAAEELYKIYKSSKPRK